MPETIDLGYYTVHHVYILPEDSMDLEHPVYQQIRRLYAVPVRMYQYYVSEIHRYYSQACNTSRECRVTEKRFMSFMSQSAILNDP